MFTFALSAMFLDHIGTWGGGVPAEVVGGVPTDDGLAVVGGVPAEDGLTVVPLVGLAVEMVVFPMLALIHVK